jgi:flavin-dependent thymidylate synthase
MKETNEPFVNMLSHTNKPLETMAYAWKVMHNDVPDSLGLFIKEHSKEEIEKIFVEMTNNSIGTPVEYVNTVWVFKNVSRAFQQQLTRYRVGTSFSIQSLRCQDVGNFADNGAYHIPENILKNPLHTELFENQMLEIQSTYNTMIAHGVAVEDARGILPLNVHSTITVAMNLRALAGIVSQRTCIHTQGEWKPIIKQMKQQVAEKISPVVAEQLFKKPCEKGACMIPEKSCGLNKKFFDCEVCGRTHSSSTAIKIMPCRASDFRELIVCPDCASDLGEN